MAIFRFIFFALLITTIRSEDECSEEPYELNVTYVEQVLTSPGWENGQYFNSLRCIYNFLVPDGKYALVVFTDFELEGDINCRKDYVELTLNGMGALSVRYCSNAMPTPTLMFSEYYPQMLFQTNNVTTNRGFRMTYRLVDSDDYCKEDEMMCTNSHCVKNSSRCDGKDDCGDGTDEENCPVKDESFKCGIPRLSPDEGSSSKAVRVIGGSKAVPGSAPWQVTLQSKNVHPSGHTCGGVLINRQWVVTAGHCISRYLKLRIKIGNYNQLKNQKGEQVRYAEMAKIHPFFNPFKLQNDIALIKLNAPIEVTDDVMPICMPKANSIPYDGIMCYATGWGRNSTSNMENVEDLNQVQVPIFNRDKCQASHKAFNREVTVKNVCTGYRDGGHNPCYGDSGGPLIRKEEDHWSLIGVVSFGSDQCGEVQPTVYTSISAYIDWIHDTIKINS